MLPFLSGWSDRMRRAMSFVMSHVFHFLHSSIFERLSMSS